MIKSMTGYGRAQKLIGGRDVTVEIKSVNHRFFEFSPRIPRSCAYLEEKLKGLAYQKAARGKIDFSLTLVQVEGGGAAVEINKPLAEAYLSALRDMGASLGLRDDVTLTSLSRFSDIFIVRKVADDEDAVWDAVREVSLEAMEKFVSMRMSEGKELELDLIKRLDAIEGSIRLIEEASPKTVEDYRAKLAAKITEVLEQKQLDEARILTEAAIFAEKTAVDEETVRIYSHISQFRGILKSGGAVGRKLDFLVQELNREANTIGSKAQDVAIAKIVVDIKSEIEKIREQVQNIE